MASEPLIQMRSAIKGMIKDLTGSDNDVAFAAFEAKHGDLLEKADRDLRRLGFIKLVNDVAGRRSNVVINPSQSELFPGMKRPTMISVPIFRGTKMTGRRRAEFDEAPIADILAWRAMARSHKREKPDPYEKVDDVLALIQGQTDDTSLTFAEGMKLLDERRANGTTNG